MFFATASERRVDRNPCRRFELIRMPHFINEYNQQSIAIEVKSGRRTNNQGLALFQKQFQPKRAFVVGSGGIPVEDFLTGDLERLLL